MALGTVIPWKVVIEETLDDVLPRLSDDLKTQMQLFSDAVMEGLQRKSASILEDVTRVWTDCGQDEKSFSKQVLEKVDLELRQLYFQMRRKQETTDPFDVILVFARKNVSKISLLEKLTNVKLDDFKTKTQ